MTPDEASERLACAILSDLADYDDEDDFPIRALFTEIAETWKVDLGRTNELPKTMTVGELRARLRDGRAALAAKGGTWPDTPSTPTGQG